MYENEKFYAVVTAPLEAANERRPPYIYIRRAVDWKDLRAISQVEEVLGQPLRCEDKFLSDLPFENRHACDEKS